jgi:hypothetical protein
MCGVSKQTLNVEHGSRFVQRILEIYSTKVFWLFYVSFSRRGLDAGNILFSDTHDSQYEMKGERR